MRSFVLLVSLFAVGCECDSDVACSTDDECGAGMACVDGLCRDRTRDDAGSLDAGAGDAGHRDGGPPIGLGCSADLREVLDAAGNVLRACPDDQGCSEGQCIPACDAASATRGTIGCELFVPTPPGYPQVLPPCHAMFVANAWPTPARLTVTRAGASYDVTTFGRIVDNARPESEWAAVPAGGIPAGAVAVLFLSSDPASVLMEGSFPSLACPVAPAINAATTVATDESDAFHVTSDAPVRAYDMLPYGGAHSHVPSAQLLLPTNAWGSEYVVLDAPPGTDAAPGPMWIQIVAREDGTSVRVRPSVALPAGGALPAIAADATETITLDAGELAQWEVGALDPSGTLVSADGPIAVFAGNRFLRLQPTPGPGGDSAHQQLLPSDALASEYVAAPYATRRADLAPEPVPYRIAGVVDGTMLTYEPLMAGAPDRVDRGGVVELTSSEPFIVRSQDAMHPFAMAQMMTTANLEGGSRPGATDPDFGLALGDEEFVFVFPPGQFLDEYLFFTDPSYATTNLVVVRARGSAGFAPVTLDCLGEVSGFSPIGTSGTFEVATVDLIRADVGNGSCANGRHLASSAAPFGLVVWGLDSYSSYAYPAGGNARTLNEIGPLF
jgi:hypothetical protein